MAIPAKYQGNCKDCGATHAIGDMIDKNGNESPNKMGEIKAHWCKFGKNCKGTMETMHGRILSDKEPQQSIPQTPRLTGNDLKAILLEDDAGWGDIITEGENEANKVIALYIGTKISCEKQAITEPPVIGMIFNNVIRRLQ